jgi:uroporphyrinogen decarboxylase
MIDLVENPEGAPDEVKAAAFDVLAGSGGEGIILSLGGGVSPGMPRANILALREALREFNAGRNQCDAIPAGL